MYRHPTPSPLTDADLALATDFVSAVTAVTRRRADLISVATVNRYVSLGWLVWRQGTLQVSPEGWRVCDAVLLPHG